MDRPGERSTQELIDGWYVPNIPSVFCIEHNVQCSLVIVLPSYYNGAEFIIKHNNQEHIFDYSSPQSELNKKQVLVQSSTLKLWAETRWDSWWQATDAIINNYPAIFKALADISEEGSGTRSTNAGGLLMHMKKSIFIITSFILHQLFGLIKVLNDHLKNPALDYVRGEHLVISIIQQITNLRNEQSFNQIYDKAKKFCDGIDLVQQCQLHRKIKISARSNDCFINSTLGQRPKLSTSTHFMNQIYFPLIDCMLVEPNDRFSSKPLSFMNSIATIYPESKIFLNIDDVDEFSRHIGADSSALKNEFTVIKSMLMPKTIIDVIQFLNELVRFSTAFPQTLRMIKSGITMPISQ
ncbi:unnamed protein product, partial [Didymodactylos carnosus]